MHQLMLYRHITQPIKIILAVGILLAGILCALYIWDHRDGLFSTQSAANQQTNLLQSGWDRMPGVSRQTDGLHIANTDRAIVRQDGSPGMSSPAVNLFGTHLYADDNYTLSATIGDLNGGAILRLYSSPPLSQDEFYSNPTNMEIIVEDSTLTLNIWGSNQSKNPYTHQPIRSITRSITRSSHHTLSMKRTHNQLALFIDNQQIIQQQYQQIFNREVWFGFTAKNKNDTWTLQAMSLTTAAPNRVYAVDTQTLLPVERTPPADALQALATSQRPDFKIGAAIALAPLVSSNRYRNIVYGGNFGSITTENALKWQFIHPQPNTYNFTDADNLVTVARQYGLTIHGHTLVFGEANPSWVQDLATTTTPDKDIVKNIMVEHITKTVGQFKGRIASWDVVNEPIDENDPTSLRPHLWFKAMSESYIATAFETAHQADPSAKLYINDYGLEADGERWDTMLALVSNLKAAGVPIDGVGFQAHVYEAADTIDPAVLRRHIQQLAQLGLTARISEMDVYSDDGLDVQAKQYSDVFKACFSEPTCTSWTTWGVADRYNLYLDDNERIVRGQDYLWDKNFQPTPAVKQIMQFLTK
jgi:endo-1,4-beta-xylanase